MKFKDGDIVIVSESSHEYNQRHIGKTGTVEYIFRKSNNKIMYGIRIPGLHNTKSQAGLFWFEARSLEHHHEDESSPLINESEEIPMFENFTVAHIQFLDNPVPVYHYALYDSNIKSGDTVVVQTGHHGFALAKIESIDTNPEAKKEVSCGREVVCKVDFSAYTARKEALKRANELQKQMDAKLREAQTMAIYEMFAEKDPALKAMLEEFKTLHSKIKGETRVGEAHEAV